MKQALYFAIWYLIACSILWLSVRRPSLSLDIRVGCGNGSGSSHFSAEESFCVLTLGYLVSFIHPPAHQLLPPPLFLLQPPQGRNKYFLSLSLSLSLSLFLFGCVCLSLSLSSHREKGRERESSLAFIIRLGASPSALTHLPWGPCMRNSFWHSRLYSVVDVDFNVGSIQGRGDECRIGPMFKRPLKRLQWRERRKVGEGGCDGAEGATSGLRRMSRVLWMFLPPSTLVHFPHHFPPHPRRGNNSLLLQQ